MNRASIRNRLVVVVEWALIVLMLLVFLFPIFWLGVTSIKLPKEISTYPPTFVPDNPTLRNYAAAFFPESAQKYMGYSGGTNAVIYLRNSLIITGLTTLIAMFIGVPAGYSLARFNTGGKHLSFWIISTRMAPPVAMMIPIFTMLRSVGLTNTHLGVVLPTLIVTLPFVIWLMKSFFSEIPVEIEEAAMSDGCSRFQAFLRVVLPLTKPGLVTSLLFSIIFSWNNFIFPLILAYTKEVQTIPVLLAGFRGAKGILYGEMAAVALVTMLPIILIAVLIQKHVIRGMTMGAVKG